MLAGLKWEIAQCFRIVCIVLNFFTRISVARITRANTCDRIKKFTRSHLHRKLQYYFPRVIFPSFTSIFVYLRVWTTYKSVTDLMTNRRRRFMARRVRLVGRQTAKVGNARRPGHVFDPWWTRSLSLQTFVSIAPAVNAFHAVCWFVTSAWPRTRSRDR